MWTLSAALILLPHFLTSAGRGSFGPHAQSISPKWSANLRTAIGAIPVGVVGGEHEHEGKPESSLWFVDNDTIVATFVTREASDNPNLSRRGTLEKSLPLRLRAVLIDASSGKIKSTADWPVESRFARIVAVHAGKIVVLTGNDLVLYSSDLKELMKLKLPTSELIYAASAAHVSLTGKNILFESRRNATTTWTWIDTDSFQVLRSWEDVPLGRVSISDSKIARTCTLFYKCEPGVDTRGLDTDWKRVISGGDRRHPPLAAFVGNDLLFLLGHSSLVLLRADGTVIFTEDRSYEGCWWGGIYPSANGQRFVVPSCKLKGHVASLDLGGYDELRKFVVYDAPFHGQSYAPDIEGVKIKELTLLAVSPDGSKLAVLNGESVYVFQLPPLV